MLTAVTTSAATSRATDAATPRRASADLAVAMLATAQHGVVERGQLRDLGLTDSAIARRIESGRLHRLRRGVYAVGHPVVGRLGQWLAAVLACGPGAHLSHASAAALQDIWRSDGALIHVTVPGPGRRSGPRLYVHRASDLGPEEVRTQLGIPVTSPARTIVDLAATAAGERMVERLLDRAETLHIGDVRTVAAAHPGHRGARRILRTLGAHAPGTTLTRSDLEELLLALCRTHRLPTPRVNHVVAGLEVDLLFAPQRLAVEADSWTYHRTRSAFERDRERDALLARAGYRVLRFSDRQIEHEPSTVAGAIAAALAEQERALSGRGPAA
jgi:very-short-patch-repair endonuclease